MIARDRIRLIDPVHKDAIARAPARAIAFSIQNDILLKDLYLLKANTITIERRSDETNYVV